jgi:hypothetical protein
MLVAGGWKKRGAFFTKSMSCKTLVFGELSNARAERQDDVIR